MTPLAHKLARMLLHPREEKEGESGEQWRDIPGYEGAYQVSDQGRVRSLDRRVLHSDGGVRFHKGRVLHPGLASNGYFTVAVGRRNSRCLHDLVLTVFAGPRPLPEAVGRHLDGNKANNTASNLCWGTRKENSADSDLHGTHPRGSQKPQAKLTETAACEIRHLRRFVSQSELARRYSVSPSAIQAIHDGRTWTHA
jgi:hypothetical protein